MSINELIEKCYKCELGDTCTQKVIERGEGKQGILIIGEAPGDKEDETGLPFVGQSGQMLEKVLNSVNLESQRDCKIINTLKCRPPENATPTKQQQYACYTWLYLQIINFNPKVILTLGNSPLSLLTEYNAISKVRGQILDIKLVKPQYIDSRERLPDSQKYTFKTYKLLPIYHPSALLRNSSRETGGIKWLTWQDMMVLAKYLGML